MFKMFKSYEYKILENQLKQEKEENSRLKSLLEKEQQRNENAFKEELNACTFAFDFKRTNVFSIERLVHKDCPQTIIGYFLEKDGNMEPRQWYFECSQEMHEKLVKQFNEIKKK